MLYIGIVILIYSMPFIWTIWSIMDVGWGKKEKVNWKGPLILFIVIALCSILVNSYLSFSYDLAFLQNSYASILGLIVVALLWALIAIINIAVTIYARRTNMPKSLHNPRTVWIMSGALAGVLFIFFLWFMPIGEKIAYIVTLNNAVSALDKAEENKDFSLVLVQSEIDCLEFSRRSSCNERYENVFYLQNNLDQPKEVQVKIRALNENKEELKVIDSKIMELGPGELKMVTTEETADKMNIWSQYSFETEEHVSYYQYKLRHRDLRE